MQIGYVPYEPQLFPVAWAENIWTVEGPEIAYRLAGAVLACPTRMAVVKLDDGSLLLHSPVTYATELDKALAKLGPISVLIAPNSYHYVHVSRWTEAHPSAEVFVSPDLITKINVTKFNLLSNARNKWSRDIRHRLVDLGRFKETVFFHKSSSTLIVTDLMQNFEPSRVHSLATRMLLKAGGATGPNGRPSIEIRLAARRHRDALRIGVEHMIAWQPTRIILSHGLCYDHDAVAEIERAFDWII